MFTSSGVDLDKYFVPMDVPNVKLEQHIFTIRKMRKELNF